MNEKKYRSFRYVEDFAIGGEDMEIIEDMEIHRISVASTVSGSKKQSQPLPVTIILALLKCFRKTESDELCRVW